MSFLKKISPKHIKSYVLGTKIYHRFTAKIVRSRLDTFVESHANALHTLDIGCANSPYSRFFPNRLGFDISPGPGVDVVGDAHALPFKDGEFEQIFCTEVLEHLHTPEKAISEMMRVPAPGGTLILTTRFVFPIHDAPHDYYRYTKYGLRHLFRNWNVITLEEEVKTMETFAVLLQRLGFQTRLRMNGVSKVLIFLLTKLALMLNWLIVEEYSDIKKSAIEGTIMTSGYYLVAQKKR